MIESKKYLGKIIEEIENNTLGGSDSSETCDDVVQKLLGHRKSKSKIKDIAQDTPKNNLELLNLACEQNNALYYIDYKQSIERSPRKTGAIGYWFRILIRKLILPIYIGNLKKQNEFNASVTRGVNIATNNLEVFYDLLEEQRKRIREQTEVIDTLVRRIDRLQDGYDDLKGTRALESDNFYSMVDYEEYVSFLHGTEEETRERFKKYLPYFEGRDCVIDLSSKLGEFLVLMNENSINTAGVEKCESLVQKLMAKGFNVAWNNGLDYITKMSDGLFDGIFVSRYVENLRIYELVKLCNTVHSKLQAGGIFVCEAVNPSCSYIYSATSYMDPDFTDFVHPQALVYFLKKAGFSDVKIVYSKDQDIKNSEYYAVVCTK
ncbi:MAG: class I SAM-dependent methyltransferase [Lachnospiraceae bacterium]|nr:class I SAM-dependent methyltransferase [Lachnospiraceae bacterium]